MSAGADVARPRHRVPTGLAATLAAAALLVSLTLAVTIGPADLAPADVWRSIGDHLAALLGGGPAEPALGALRDGIVWELRLPRVLTAAAVGAGLAVAGAVMQSVTRNPLADPYLLGLSSGASLGAVAVLVLGVGVLLPVAAFVGALLFTLMPYRIVYRVEFNMQLCFAIPLFFFFFVRYFQRPCVFYACGAAVAWKPVKNRTATCTIWPTILYAASGKCNRRGPITWRAGRPVGSTPTKSPVVCETKMNWAAWRCSTLPRRRFSRMSTWTMKPVSSTTW